MEEMENDVSNPATAERKVGNKALM